MSRMRSDHDYTSGMAQWHDATGITRVPTSSLLQRLPPRLWGNPYAYVYANLRNNRVHSLGLAPYTVQY
jgi:hypothetical protein